MTEIESKTFPNGYKVVVSIDPEPQSPREWDNFGTVVIPKVVARSRAFCGYLSARRSDARTSGY